MKLNIIRRTIRVDTDFRVMYSIGTDFCIWSGMDSFGRYLWREFELPDEDGIHVFNLTALPLVPSSSANRVSSSKT